MKNRTVITAVTIIVVLTSVAVGSAAVIDEVLFGTNAGRESASSPPTPHDLLKLTWITEGSLEDLSNGLSVPAGQNFLQWLFTTPVGGGSATLTLGTRDKDTEPTGGWAFSDSAVDLNNRVGFTSLNSPTISGTPPNASKSYQIQIPFDALKIDVKYSQLANGFLIARDAKLDGSAAVPLAYDIVAFGSSTRLGRPASMTAHSTVMDAPGNVEDDDLYLVNSTGQRAVTWKFTVPVAGIYDVQLHTLDGLTESAGGWGFQTFSIDANANGFDGGDALTLRTVDTVNKVEIFQVTFATPGLYDAQLSAGSGIIVDFGAMIAIPEPTAMTLLGLGGLALLLGRRR